MQAPANAHLRRQASRKGRSCGHSPVQASAATSKTARYSKQITLKPLTCLHLCVLLFLFFVSFCVWFVLVVRGFLFLLTFGLFMFFVACFGFFLLSATLLFFANLLCVSMQIPT